MDKKAKSAALKISFEAQFLAKLKADAPEKHAAVRNRLLHSSLADPNPNSG